MNNYQDMTKDEHEDLLCYLEELMSQAMAVRYSHEWFMKSDYMKLVNDTFSELVSNDAIEAGL